MQRRTILMVFALLAVMCAGAAAADAHGRDGAIIRNSGSTNARGYSVKVWSTGATSTGGITGRVPIALAQQFFRQLAATRSEGKGAAGGCMKSASFGTTTVALWHGWTSSDLSCPQSGAHARVLAGLVAQILRAVDRQQPAGRSVHLPINEPRRAPVEGTPAPRATPPS